MKKIIGVRRVSEGFAFAFFLSEGRMLEGWIFCVRRKP